MEPDRGRSNLLSRRGRVAGLGSAALFALVFTATAQTNDLDRVSLLGVKNSILEASANDAVTLALKKLSDPRCQRIFTDFRDRSGHPLQRQLDSLGHTGAGFLRILRFANGVGLLPCQSRGVLAATTPLSHVDLPVRRPVLRASAPRPGARGGARDPRDAALAWSRRESAGLERDHDGRHGAVRRAGARRAGRRHGAAAAGRYGSRRRARDSVRSGRCPASRRTREATPGRAAAAAGRAPCRRRPCSKARLDRKDCRDNHPVGSPQSRRRTRWFGTGC